MSIVTGDVHGLMVISITGTPPSSPKAGIEQVRRVQQSAGNMQNTEEPVYSRTGSQVSTEDGVAGEEVAGEGVAGEELAEN